MIFFSKCRSRKLTLVVSSSWILGVEICDNSNRRWADVLLNISVGLNVFLSTFQAQTAGKMGTIYFGFRKTVIRKDFSIKNQKVHLFRRYWEIQSHFIFGINCLCYPACIFLGTEKNMNNIPSVYLNVSITSRIGKHMSSISSSYF